MTYTYTIPVLLMSTVLLSPLLARGDIIFDPDAPPEPVASTTPEDTSEPIDWVGDIEWGCDEGWGPDGIPFTHCGLGRYRRLCGFNAGVPDCHTFFELQEAPLVSSVLFLPGIKGSRLYANDEKLWEPSGSGDVVALSLNEQGRSASAEVHAKEGDLLSQVFGHELYAFFFSDLDSFKEEGTFGENWDWKAAAYDWRLSLTDIVTLGSRDNDRIFYNAVNGTPYIEQVLRELAASSPTGKVTIVAHSNGGLVAKALTMQLGAEAEELIEQIIFVGVPQSGAPRALAGALFGYGEALPFDACANWTAARLLCGLLVDRGTARAFAEHSPMTYHLLPSEAYFNATNDDGYPVASFSGMTFYPKERERYGVTINTASELYDFALAVEEGRTKPAPEDLKNANVLSSALIAYARDIHSSLDAWTPPQGVRVYQLAGWGKETFSGIQFYEKPGVLGLFGGEEATYRPMFIEDGDGVVPVKSALMYENDAYWVNLSDTDNSHADLLELPDVRTYIRSILSGTETDLPPLITASKPASERRSIMFVLHSPLTLGLYDESGKYTGLNEDGTAVSEVPNVEYGELGEVKYLLAPADHNYELVMRGLETGTFMLEILERVGNEVSTTSSMVNVPTSSHTVARLRVQGVMGTIADLEVDYGGDGTVDIQITPQLGGPVVYEGAIPSTPEPPIEASPNPPAPESTSETNGSARQRSPEPLSFVEVSETKATTTPPSMIEENTPEPPAPARKETREPVPPPARTQTASVYDAFGRSHYMSLLALTGVVLLVLILIGKKRKRVDAE